MDKPIIDGQLALDVSAMSKLVTQLSPDERTCAQESAEVSQDGAVRALRAELRRERLARQICAELTNFTQLHEALAFVILRLQELSSADHVAIRLEVDGEYPCVVHTDNGGGETEGEGTGGRREGRSLVDCFCDVVMSGHYQQALDFFTPGGSFWCRSVTALLNSTAGARLLRQRTRYSHRSDCESLALIPLSARGIRVGLIQLQDARIAMFDEELIGFIEDLGHQIGLAVQNARAYTELEASMGQLRVLHGVLPICASCKKIRDAGRWKALEEFITQNSQADFTHGLCPDCAADLYPEVYTGRKPHTS